MKSLLYQNDLKPLDRSPDLSLDLVTEWFVDGFGALACEPHGI
jgi:hypothetical protein